MAKAKSAKKAQGQKQSQKQSQKQGSKAAGPKKKVTATKAAASKTSAKKASTKAPATSAKSATSAKKSSAKVATAPTVKTSAKSAAPKTSTKKVAEAAVTQVANALKSVATRVTNAFSSGSDKKKVRNPQLKTPAELASAFAPLDDRIVVAREEAETRTAGGLYIPDTASVEKSNRGTVVVVGPGHRDKKGRLRPLDVQIGDTVVFGPWVGSDIKIDGQEYLLLRESDLLAIVND